MYVWLREKALSSKEDMLRMIHIFIYFHLLQQMGSASGVVCKQVAQWVRTFSTQEIEFFAIHFPKEPWKKLADICHLNPSKVNLMFSDYIHLLNITNYTS